MPPPYNVVTLEPASELSFTWDPAKARINEEKHGVAFEEGTTVFLDDEALLIGDPDHSADEDRFMLLGLSSFTRLLVVCHAVYEDGDTIRLISARKARRKEQRQYLERYR